MATNIQEAEFLVRAKLRREGLDKDFCCDKGVIYVHFSSCREVWEAAGYAT